MQWDAAKLVRLRSDQLEAWISPRHGGALACLFESASGFQILRETPREAIANGETMKFGCFPMVPYSNRIGFRRMEFGNQIITLNSNRAGAAHSFHGNAWMAEWCVDELQENRLDLSFAHVEGNGHWPFPYRVEQSFTLDANICRMRLVLHNTGEHAFPAGAGWHPFFNIEPQSRVSFNARQVWLNDQDMLPRTSQPAKGEWDFGLGRSTNGLAVDNCFQGWDGTATLEHPAQRRAVFISGSQALSSLVVFRPNDGREFIAIEPVTHVNNGINLMAQGRPDTGVRILLPGESMDVMTEFRLSHT